MNAEESDLTGPTGFPHLLYKQSCLCKEVSIKIPKDRIQKASGWKTRGDLQEEEQELIHVLESGAFQAPWDLSSIWDPFQTLPYVISSFGCFYVSFKISFICH